ncbi:uncharacterized protein BDR25DRAFT_358855 [Lindgomyces ingoldianus]|uniref:Uncharacterized protein n=1 Tax=Lindgomyces ingoldianus TaxID=673940 RepID=A0ACB6QJX9_9PLEO|nr:uncharacterized protein BDR25DRAFT_358855 [Lindgomyces ingoldianus]KAF2467308.1 hypothetical protein BDR25DRAFT_358855 [Lindgomyces ingoldianus]
MIYTRSDQQFRRYANERALSHPGVFKACSRRCSRTPVHSYGLSNISSSLWWGYKDTAARDVDGTLPSRQQNPGPSLRMQKLVEIGFLPAFALVCYYNGGWGNLLSKSHIIQRLYGKFRLATHHTTLRTDLKSLSVEYPRQRLRVAIAGKIVSQTPRIFQLLLPPSKPLVFMQMIFPNQLEGVVSSEVVQLESNNFKLEARYLQE